MKDEFKDIDFRCEELEREYYNILLNNYDYESPYFTSLSERQR